MHPSTGSTQETTSGFNNDWDIPHGVSPVPYGFPNIVPAAQNALNHSLGVAGIGSVP